MKTSSVKSPCGSNYVSDNSSSPNFNSSLSNINKKDELFAQRSNNVQVAEKQLLSRQSNLAAIIRSQNNQPVIKKSPPLTCVKLPLIFWSFIAILIPLILWWQNKCEKLYAISSMLIAYLFGIMIFKLSVSTLKSNHPSVRIELDRFFNKQLLFFSIVFLMMVSGAIFLHHKK
jgi:hypothetical protein